jgi:hypothetical protein
VTPTLAGGRHETFYRHGFLYREGGLPSSIIYDEDGYLVEEKYTDKDGNYHRVDGPAVISYHEKCSRISRAEWWINGKMHNVEGSAVKSYFLDGNISYYCYKDEVGRPHRDGSMPAEVYFNECGKVKIETYYHHGMKHRDHLPANIHYNIDGSKSFIAYYSYGKLDRKDGPALIKFDKDGNPTSQKWFDSGVLKS